MRDASMDVEGDVDVSTVPVVMGVVGEEQNEKS